jgi:thioredoxin reductase (NADPH)
MHLYDSIVVGGGPAGLSAAIYVARYNRSCFVVDMGWGRSSTHEENENYLGFPKGVRATQLRILGQTQAEKFGAQFCQDKIIKIEKLAEGFLLTGGSGKYHGKTVILATGASDLWPTFENFQDYLGKSLFWCITCDGHKSIGKKVAVVGDTDDCACTAMQLLNFTKDVVFVTNQDHSKHRIRHQWRTRMEKAGIKIYEGKITHVHGRNGLLRCLELTDKTTIDIDFMFNQQGATPNSELAEELGIDVNEHGYIKTNHEMRTSVPFVYAAGDVTRLHSHQIIIAAAEGATAGETANYDLYRPEQKWQLKI